MMRRQLNDSYQAISNARDQVERADQAYRKGGGVDRLNRANRDMAAATQRLYEVQSGNVPDRR